jgi:hypothetical protein
MFNEVCAKYGIYRQSHRNWRYNWRRKFGFTKSRLRPACQDALVKEALPRQFKDRFQRKGRRTVCFKISFHIKQQNGLAKPGHSAARA